MDGQGEWRKNDGIDSHAPAGRVARHSVQAQPPDDQQSDQADVDETYGAEGFIGSGQQTFHRGKQESGTDEQDGKHEPGHGLCPSKQIIADARQDRFVKRPHHA